MSSSSDLHALTEDLITDLPQPLQQQAWEEFRRDSDPVDVLTLLTAQHTDSMVVEQVTDWLRTGIRDHDRMVWGVE